MSREHTFMIPENLDFDMLVGSGEPFADFREEKLLETIDNLTRIPSHSKDLDSDSEGWVPVNASVLRTRIGNNYHKYLAYLVRIGVFECNGYFSKDTHTSRKYRFAEVYNRPLKQYSTRISTWLLRKVIPISLNSTLKLDSKEVVLLHSLKAKLPIERLALNQSELSAYDKHTRLKYHYLYKWFDMEGLTVDSRFAEQYIYKRKDYIENGFWRPKMVYNKAKKLWVGKNTLNQLRASQYSLNSFKRQSDNSRIDTNVFRLHSILTSLNKELRHTVTWQGEQLVSVDIVNSQPFLLSTLFDAKFWSEYSRKNTINIHNLPYNHNYKPYIPISELITLCNFIDTHNPSDIRKFKDLVVRGKLYEYMANKLSTATKQYTREDAKTTMYSVLFSDNNAIKQNWAKPIRNFKTEFPFVYRICELVKTNLGKMLPLLLQRIESHLILDNVTLGVSKRYPNLPLFTIHDSIVTVKGYESLVVTILEEVSYKLLKIIPTHKVEYWDSEQFGTGLKNQHLMYKIYIDEVSAGAEY